jgi:xanthine dehydrogenase YagR molybdenum-binding subunit
VGADRPLDRVDAVAKVTGAARYATEQPAPGVAYAVMVTSTIARGRIVAIEGTSAEGVSGVLAVLTHQNAEKLPRRRREDGDAPVLHLLQDGAIRYANQPIAVVVADTLEAAREGARLVRVRYAAEPPGVSLEPRQGSAYAPDQGADEAPDSRRGDVASALDRSDVRVEQAYTTPFETHNPMEPHATMAAWDGPRALTLHDGTQGIFDCRARVAEVLGLAPEDVRVISPYLGGGFGSKGPVWSHVVLAAMAARAVSRPVRLALTRPQMFGPVGWRSRTVQRVAIGATRAGAITAIRHDTLAQTSSFDEFVELAGLPARMLYACPHNATSHRLVRADIGTPSYMRAPGWAPGTYALECAMDELAYALDKDPVDLRLENYAAEDPETGRPWSENALRECYREGAERFGWSRRPRARGPCGTARSGSAGAWRPPSIRPTGARPPRSRACTPTAAS